MTHTTFRRVATGLALVAVGLLSFPALAAWVLIGSGPGAYEDQTLTRAAPTASSDGVSLTGVKRIRVSVCAESGQTLSGAGTLRAYYYSQSAALWMRNPSLDLPISVTATSCGGAACRCQVFPDMEGGPAFGRTLWANDSVTASGGTTARVRIEVMQ